MLRRMGKGVVLTLAVCLASVLSPPDEAAFDTRTGDNGGQRPDDHTVPALDARTPSCGHAEPNPEWSALLACPGDSNCDHVVGFADIDLFVAAIPNNQANWAVKYEAYCAHAPPAWCWQNCDVNGNGNVGFDDIDPFVAKIPSVCPGSGFPFSICGDQFYRNGKPVFLNIIGYQPLEPCQGLWDPISEQRIVDDLRRLQAFQGGSDPVILRVYPQPVDANTPRLRQSFYDGVRELGFWIIRDIYLPGNCDSRAGYTAVEAAINEVAEANAQDLVFSWELGNEYSCASCPNVAEYLGTMAAYLRSKLAEPGFEGCSNWVTWAAWPPTDPLWTEPYGCPIEVASLDYYSYNAYSYWPEHVRDHQGGARTGTPFAGYLTAMKQRLSGKPLVVSELGLPDSPSPSTAEQANLKSWYPVYRYGGLSGAQVAEGLAERYWEARLAGVAGVTVFEWNDEWHKTGAPCVHDDHAEEHFGLLSFDLHQPGVPAEPRFKLAEDVVCRLFALKSGSGAPSVTVHSDAAAIAHDGSTTIRAIVHGAVEPVRLRWDASRGHVVGESSEVTFYAGGRALGPAIITATVIDSADRAASCSTEVAITLPGPPSLEILTLGEGSLLQARASGRVRNVDLGVYKVVFYIQTNNLYIQPYSIMNSIWIRADGHWWTQVANSYDGAAVAWLVPSSFSPPDVALLGWTPLGAIASATLAAANDADNDLLPDSWEVARFGTTSYMRYDDPDADLADNLEEFLSDPNAAGNNDSDSDLLPDTWEQRFFGTLALGAADDPDADGWDNAAEFGRGTHPSRKAADSDLDGMPDLWELHWFHDLAAEPSGDLNGDGVINIEAYELGLAP